MAKFSMKRGGKEVGPASVYAEPHSKSTSGVTTWADNGYGPDRHHDGNDVPMSVGAIRSKPYPPPKTSGVEMRGAGAATKGRMSRGSMA